MWKFGTVGELALTYHHHPKLAVYIRIYSAHGFCRPSFGKDTAVRDTHSP